MASLRLFLAAGVLVLATAGVSFAQTNAERADQLNNEGKAAMKAKDFPTASDRFQQAIVLSREGRFYFNLCVSLYSQGKLVDSLEACKAVESAGADAALREKTTGMIGKVRDEMKRQGYDPDAPVNQNPTNPTNPTDPNNPTNPTDPNNPTNPTDPNNPNNPNNPTNPNNPNPNNPAPVFRPPPTTALFESASPQHHYTWTLGAELLGGTSNFGGNDTYSAPMYGFRVLGDYLILPSKKVGVQATIGVMHTDESDSEGTAGIDVVDVGIGGYKHFCGGGRICFTPLIGASLGLLQPNVSGFDTGNDALLSLGIRAEGRVGFALGNRYEHLISISAGFQGYTRGTGTVGGFNAEDVDLDGFSTVGLIAIGYTYRFNTPFGSSPFVTLE
jgi:hypothetical protein